MKKRSLVIYAAIIGSVLFCGAKFPDEDVISVEIDGKQIEFDVQPVIEDGHTLVPFRKVLESLGAKVIWNDESKTAYAQKDGTVVSIKQNERYIYKDGGEIALETPARKIGGRMLIPVRAVSEAFGYDVTWDGATQTVIITSAAGDIESLEKYGLPEYSGQPYIVINDNKAYFDASDITTEPFEEYSDLDSLGRCGTAFANICPEIMPEGERTSISSITPTGWLNVKYDFVSGKYLYNRCHLIGYQLAGENANKQNIITGTRYLNTEGMLPFENMVADYVEETAHHVLYRVKPLFGGDNLVAYGVYMEAKSVEDEEIEYNVFCYNVQPGVVINYRTGESRPELTYSGNDKTTEETYSN